MEYLHAFSTEHALTLSAGILILAYIFIATEKISKTTVALIGACAVIFLGLVDQEKYSKNGINFEYYINYIDFNVIFLLIAMMIIVSITAKSGIFNYAAARILSLTRGRPALILISLAFFTAITSAFLDNVTTVILVLPMTFAIAEKLEINPLPFLITEIFSSNIGGTATLIGDPPNIIIGSAAGLSFMDFVRELSPIVALIMVAVCALMLVLFRKSLKVSENKTAASMRFDGNDCAVDRARAARSMIVLGLVIAGFACHDAIGMQTSIIALMGASALLVFEKPEEIFRELEWNTIFFFIGLFVIVGALEASGGIKLMADFILDVTRGSQAAASMAILWGSGVISGVIDNIPYTATMAPMILEMEKAMGSEYAYPLWWSLSLGACLGGNMTIIGAAANVVVSENAAKRGYEISFMRFFKYGVVVMILSLSISALGLWLKFFI
ncbi:MAG: hypothetical protein DBX55_10405 [Verrucomicrobia bacterium]|nr:MAG: hypothetical protein DBX55_10405 [Verrucomicrobiota bacterium]